MGWGESIEVENKLMAWWDLLEGSRKSGKGFWLGLWLGYGSERVVFPLSPPFAVLNFGVCSKLVSDFLA